MINKMTTHIHLYKELEEEQVGGKFTEENNFAKGKSKRICLVWFVGFYGISTFVGYLTPNPFSCK